MSKSCSTRYKDILRWNKYLYLTLKISLPISLSDFKFLGSTIMKNKKIKEYYLKIKFENIWMSYKSSQIS